MILNFRSVVGFALILTLGVRCLGQEPEEEQKEAVFMELGGGYVFSPWPVGDNYVAEGYDIHSGYSISYALVFKKHWTVAVQFSKFKGDVSDITVVGAIERSRFRHFYLSGAYSLWPYERKIGLLFGAGLGTASYRHHKDGTRFRDNGFSLIALAKFDYRFTDFLSIYAEVKNHWDFIGIDTAPELEGFFGNTWILVPSIGLQFVLF